MTTAFTITAALVLVAGLFAVIVERTTERDEARETVRRLESECNEHAAVSADLARRLAEAESTTVRVPLLRVVPPQRDGSEYEWPAIMRAVEGEMGGAS
jgi:vacuolar-type H+-ATPase subunit F/Vma7